jgi:cell division protein ZapA
VTKQMEFTILGQSYVLACPEGGETALQKAVESVNREMSSIRDAGKVRARERIAVLAALNLAYALADRPAVSATASIIEGTAIDAVVARIDQALGADGQLI